MRQTRIPLGLKGLAKFMVASEAAKLKVLQDYKYPDPEGIAMARYYHDARQWIQAYHANGREPEWLLERADELSQAEDGGVRQRRSRLDCNARALRKYAQAFDSSRYSEVDSAEYLQYEVGSVQLGCRPDFSARYCGRRRYVRLEITDPPPVARAVNVLRQGLFDALTESGVELMPADIQLVLVASGEVAGGARLGPRLRADIEAACRMVEAMWESIQPADGTAKPVPVEAQEEW